MNEALVDMASASDAQVSELRLSSSELGQHSSPTEVAMILLELIETGRPSWWQDAKCRGRGNALFFPSDVTVVRLAQRVCRVCPVRQECGDYGADEPNGVWGGTSARARRRTKKEHAENLAKTVISASE